MPRKKTSLPKIGPVPSDQAKAAANKVIRIVIVEDERMLAETLSAWLAGDSRFQIVGEATGAQEGWKLCLAERPNLVLLDVGMPDGDGLTLALHLRAELPDCRIVILTARVDPHTAWRAHQARVHGLLDKTSSLKELHAALCAVADGATIVSPPFQKIREGPLAHAEAFYKVLSNRELEVLSCVTEGLTDKDIARVLKISELTVASHRKNLRKKLHLHDDRSLIAYGRKLGTFGWLSRARK